MRDHLLLLQGMLSEPAEAAGLRPQPDHSLVSPVQIQFRKHTAAPQDLRRSDPRYCQLELLCVTLKV